MFYIVVVARMQGIECEAKRSRCIEKLWSISRVVVGGGQKSRHLGDRIPIEATTQFEKCKSTNRAKHIL